MSGAPERLTIDLGERSYPVILGDGLLGIGSALEPFLSRSQVAIVTNTVVGPLYLEALRAGITAPQVEVFTLPDGEQHKSLEQFERLMRFLLERRFARSASLLALGGGVVGDLTGFAAACYQRGVDFIQVPTTLLAQVDSSVGGKTAVNHPLGKNMIGAFYQPRAVLADVDTLASLPAREYRAGLAEVVKYGVINDEPFFVWLEANAQALAERDLAALRYAIRRSVENKAAVVAADEREGGLRAILNFGHTFGHAIETLTGYTQYLHGEAVAIGMVQAALLSSALGFAEQATVLRIARLLDHLGLTVAPPALEPDAMVQTMGLDKKVQDGKLRLILVQKVGKVAVRSDVPGKELRAALTEGQQRLAELGFSAARGVSPEGGIRE